MKSQEKDSTLNYLCAFFCNHNVSNVSSVSEATINFFRSETILTINYCTNENLSNEKSQIRCFIRDNLLGYEWVEWKMLQKAIIFEAELGCVMRIFSSNKKFQLEKLISLTIWNEHVDMNT